MTTCSPSRVLRERTVKKKHAKDKLRCHELITSPNGFWLLYIGERLPHCFSHEYEWVIHEMISWIQIPSWRMHPWEKQNPTPRKGSLLYTLHFLKDFYLLLMLAQNLEVQTKSWCFFKAKRWEVMGFSKQKIQQVVAKKQLKVSRLVFPPSQKEHPPDSSDLYLPPAKLSRKWGL